MTYDQWKTESGYSEREEGEVAAADAPVEPYPWMKHITQDDQNRLMYKVLDYLDKDNVFGDHFSENERLQIITLLGRLWEMP